MHEPEYCACHGFMPSGERRFFETEDAYLEAYAAEENEIVDELARLHAHDEPVEIPEPWPTHEWLEYA